VLRRAGIDVCVVDGAWFPRDKVCGDAVSNSAVCLIDELGAGAAMRGGPHGLVRRAAAVFPDGSRIERHYNEPGYIVPRLHLDDSLRRALEAAGARLIQGCRVSGLIWQGGCIVGATGTRLRWAARVVIAADGYGSIGLRTMGIAAPRGTQLAVSTTAYFRNVAFPEGPNTSDHFFESELPYGYAWIFPPVCGVSNVGVYTRADAYAAGGKKLTTLLDDFIRRHPARFQAAEMLGSARTWSLPIAPRPMRLSTPGLLLAGDAAGFVDPLSGEGIWQALHSGMLAGDIATYAVRNGLLGRELQGKYAAACERALVRPSRRKAWIQRAMNLVVMLKLYEKPAVRTALRWGYEHRALEIAKN
jgi:geranylgeranyl reductase family protein